MGQNAFVILGGTAYDLPVILRIYGEVSVLGIVLNLVVLPTVSVVLICGLCCAGYWICEYSIGRLLSDSGGNSADVL